MMIRKLLVLGAGFSRPIGIPTMPHCYEELKKIAFETHEWNFNEGPVHESVVAESILKRWFNTGLDIEGFGERLLQNSNTVPGRRLLAQFSAVLIRGFELAMQHRGSDEIRRLWNSFYLPFVQAVIATGHTAFVTFNYDLLLDQALLQQGYCPDYCLTSNVRHVNESDNVGTPIKLLRPNGSMNWFVCDDEACDVLTVKWQRDGRSTEKYPGNWGTGPERHRHHLPQPDVETLLRFLIVPPGMKTRLPQPHVETVYAEVERLAETVESIFFIGWSAPDTDQQWAARVFRTRGAEVFVINRDDRAELLRRYAAVLHPECKVRLYTGDSGDVRSYNQADCEWGKRLLS